MWQWIIAGGALFVFSVWVGHGWIVKAYPDKLRKMFGGVKVKDLDKFKPSNNGQHQKRA